jgi:hypothetical protein
LLDVALVKVGVDAHKLPLKQNPIWVQVLYFR